MIRIKNILLRKWGCRGRGGRGVFNIQVLSRCLCAAVKNKVIISSAMERAPWPSGHYYCECHQDPRQLNSPWKLYWKKKRKEYKKNMSAVTMEADSGAECIIWIWYGLRPFADVVALIMIRYCARLISAAVSHVKHLFPYIIIIITSLLIPSLAAITSSPFYLDCWHFSSVVCSVNMQNKDKKETSRSLNCLERVLQISVQ